MATYYTVPNSQTNGLFSGNCYAFGASGGFTVLQGFSEIMMNIPDLLDKYDVTNAIQLKFSARTLNTKVGILKDASNFNVVQAWFDPMTESHHYDKVKICACEFVDGLATDSVITVGRMRAIYNDFKYTVGSYFGDPGGFASLFAYETEFDINNGGVFDASAFIQVVNSSTFSMSGSFVSNLSGDVVISDINKTLQYAVDANIFRNRSPAIRNYGVIDGFVAGDLVFIPEGFTITLSIDIQAETLLPINNVGPSFLYAIRDKLNWTQGYVKRTTTWSTTNITQKTTVPILLVLTDTDLKNYLNYGRSWVISTNINDTSSNSNEIIPTYTDNWLAISLSTTGKYQTTITLSGDIYVSNNYGFSRIPNINIGTSESNSVAISFTGQHQTACNGKQILVSNDYGQTWNPTFQQGTSNIFVSISLTGKYQTVVSCGDNVYTSNDFGLTWTANNTDNELYYSIEGFPTAGIAISYNGQYQTIVTENIYVSNDFGQTWTPSTTFDEFDDRNWQSIAMSSDGKIQVAIENGGDIYKSSDYGVTWNFLPNDNIVNRSWQSISVSATGQYQTVLEREGNIFVSIDYGETWSEIIDPLISGKNWQAVSVSSDGLYQCAVEYGGKIYISNVLLPSYNDEPCLCPHEEE
jgi:photosystem II stability/assembly factor-like uncharacterized protein